MLRRQLTQEAESSSVLSASRSVTSLHTELRYSTIMFVSAHLRRHRRVAWHHISHDVMRWRHAVSISNGNNISNSARHESTCSRHEIRQCQLGEMRTASILDRSRWFCPLMAWCVVINTRTLHVACAWSLAANMTSSTKPEVDDILQRHHAEHGRVTATANTRRTFADVSTPCYKPTHWL